jgi:hypothetical protein
VGAQPLGDFGIVGEAIELAVEQRKRLLLDGMGILEAGDEDHPHGGKVAAGGHWSCSAGSACPG